MELDDFTRYAKEQFDCDINIKRCDNSESFTTIFGSSFIDEEEGIDINPYHGDNALDLGGDL